MTVYLKRKDIPQKCYECPFINSDDACILQDEEANSKADSWNDLQKGCPIKSIEDVQADTVKKMQDRLKECAYDLKYYDGVRVPIVEVHCIDRTAKDLVEGKDTE